ncbi:HAD family hydrolase, partial [Neptunomonas phycophila]|uniref:HAD family hydrolase n=1 Tax=Neptunomonas phycophila TaxID=1572645 RepID=UPI00351729B6
MKKIAIFDFDGVIVDSLMIKLDAFIHCFGIPLTQEQQAQAKHIHLSTGGIPRAVKIQMMLDTFQSESITGSMDDFLARFQITLDDRMRSLTIDDATRSMLYTLQKEGIAIFINSAAPVNEIKETLKNNQLLDCFVAVYGGDERKPENFDKIADITGQHVNRVFVGDADYDEQAAHERHI